jgi:hypothetical protein
MNDMSGVIAPKSDQINADDLLSASMTVTITDVKVKPGQDQPVSIMFEGSDKAYRPCKSMCRVMVSAWGPDTSKYKGRSLTLYCDPKVKWGGMEVGGIRISHMSHIDASMTMALTVTRANKKPFTVRPLATKAAAQASPSVATADSPYDVAVDPGPVAAPITITPDQALEIEDRCKNNDIDITVLKAYYKITLFSQITQEQFVDANKLIDKRIASRAAKRAAMNDPVPPLEP